MSKFQIKIPTFPFYTFLPSEEKYKESLSKKGTTPIYIVRAKKKDKINWGEEKKKALQKKMRRFVVRHKKLLFIAIYMCSLGKKKSDIFIIFVSFLCVEKKMRREWGGIPGDV